jgi:phenylalanyl-tRNA synthetase alpha chain
MAHTVSTTLLPDLPRLTPDSAVALCTDALELQVGTSRGVVRIGQAGVLTNEALASLRLDPIRFSAILLRLDLDRVLMLRKGIDDVELLRSEDPLVKSQLLELGRFRNICEMSA